MLKFLVVMHPRKAEMVVVNAESVGERVGIYVPELATHIQVHVYKTQKLGGSWDEDIPEVSTSLQPEDGEAVTRSLRPGNYAAMVKYHGGPNGDRFLSSVRIDFKISGS